MAPGCPELLVIDTPMVIPCSFCSTLITGMSFIMSPFRVLADPVKEDLVKLPYPVTTTSSRFMVSGWSTTFRCSFLGTFIN